MNKMDIICKKCSSKMDHIKLAHMWDNIYTNEFLYCENCNNLIMNSDVEKYINENKILYFISDLFDKFIKEV